MKCLLLILLTCSAISSLSQKKSITYIVDYHSKTTLTGEDMGIKNDAKTEMSFIRTDKGDTIVNEKDSLLISSLISMISIETDLSVIANDDSAILLFRNTHSRILGSDAVINTPDTCFYAHNSWVSLSRDERKPIQNNDLKFVKTNDSKKILGILCTKYETIKTSPDRYWIWVAPLLPKTIIPQPGMSLSSGAILEIQKFGKSPSITTATNLRKSDIN